MPADADTHAVTLQLHRPSRQGQRFHVQGELKDDVTFTRAGADNRPFDESRHTTHAVFAGQAEILEVDDAGNDVKVSYTLSKFTLDRGDDAPPASLPTGVVVIIDGTHGVESRLTFKGKNIPKTMRDVMEQWIREALSVARPGVPSEQEVFAPPANAKPGDKWPMQAEPFVAMLKVFGTQAAPADVSGTVTYVSDSGEAAVVQAEATIRNASYTGDAGGMTDVKSDIQLIHVIQLPHDLSQKVTRMVMASSQKTTATDGEGNRLTFTGSRTLEISQQPESSD